MNSAADTAGLDRARAMLIASAVGDALGWPQERRDRVRDVPDRDEEASKGPFVAWTRNAGTRFSVLIESIGAGHYSDDTQMLIATARARLAAGDDWFNWLSGVELPFFLLYERGAGATVKRACRAWARGRRPWAVPKSEDIGRYFSSGANGAAMRIAPHVLIHCRDRNFDLLAADVLRDAVLTHGHPRALIGALLHASALWSTLRQDPPFPYGWLIDTLIEGVGKWREFPATKLSSDWTQAANRHFDGSFDALWADTINEVEGLLIKASEVLRQGAVSSPGRFLRDIGATDRKSNGSGTVSAVGAAFIAAWSAPNPEKGLRLAAHLDGADTDTLASMAGGLLGATLGAEWLGSAGRVVQDSKLLASLADQLVADISTASSGGAKAVPSVERVKEFERTIPSLREAEEVTLPDNREAIVEQIVPLSSKSRSMRRTQIRTLDGQTLFFIHKSPSEDVGQAVGQAVAVSDDVAREVISAIEVKSHDVKMTRRIFEDILGMTPTRAGNNWARYQNLVIMQKEPSERFDSQGIRIRIRSNRASEIRKRAAMAGLRVVEATQGDVPIVVIEVTSGVSAVILPLAE